VWEVCEKTGYVLGEFGLGLEVWKLDMEETMAPTKKANVRGKPENCLT
jgi:hypothetical protein